MMFLLLNILDKGGRWRLGISQAKDAFSLSLEILEKG